MEKNYNKVVKIYFLSADEKKSSNLAFNRPINRPTVGQVNVIAVLAGQMIGYGDLNLKIPLILAISTK